MLSEIPAKISKLKGKELDKQILRLGIIAELDAVNLYEQMASLTKNRKIRETLLDIAREEKAHVGEFESMLFMIDKEQVTEYAKGKKEVEEQFIKL